MSSRMVCVVLVLVVAALRVVAAWNVEPTAEEAYHFITADVLEKIYYGSGPGSALAIRAGNWLAGTQGERVLFIVAGAVSGLLIFHLGRRLGSETTGLWSVIVFYALPWQVFNGFRALPSAFVCALLLLALSQIWRAHAARSFSMYWIGAGLATAAAVYFNYAAVLLVPAVALGWLFSHTSRKELLRPGYWSFLLVTLACCVPLVRWNMQRDGIMISHVLHGGVLSSSFPPGMLWLRTTVLDLAHGLSPLGLLLLPTIPLLVWRHAHAGLRTLWYVIAGWMLLVVLVMPRSCDVVVFAVATPVVVAVLLRAIESSGWRVLLIATLFILTALSPWWGRFTRVADAGGWRIAAQSLVEIIEQFTAKSGHEPFLIAENAPTAAALMVHLREAGERRVFVPESQHIESQFSFWPRYDGFVNRAVSDAPGQTYFTEQKGVNPYVGRPALYVTSSAADEPPQAISNAFERWELLTQIPVDTPRGTIRTLQVFVCYSYQTLPL